MQKATCTHAPVTATAPIGDVSTDSGTGKTLDTHLFKVGVYFF